MKKNILLLLLLFAPFIVNAKNVNDLNFKWSKDYTTEVFDVIYEDDDYFTFTTSSETIEKYNKLTGEREIFDLLKDDSVVSSYRDVRYYTFDNYYIVYNKKTLSGERVYEHTFYRVSKDDLKVEASKVIGTTTGTFTNIYKVGNKMYYLDDNADYYAIDIDNNFDLKLTHTFDNQNNVVIEDKEDYTSDVILYDKNNNEIKRVNYEYANPLNVIDNKLLLFIYDKEKYKIQLLDSSLKLIDEIISNDELSFSDYELDFTGKIYILDEKKYIVDVEKDKIKLTEDIVITKDIIEEQFHQIISDENPEDDLIEIDVEYNDENYLVYEDWRYDNEYIRLYDDKQKIILKKGVSELLGEEFTIYDIFLVEDKIGVLGSLNNQIEIRFYDQKGTLIHTINTERSPEVLGLLAERYDGEVAVSDNGILVTLYVVYSYAKGITIPENETNLFPSNINGYLTCTNVHLLYYELPFYIETKTDGNGTINSSKYIANYNEKITYTVTPNKGYKLEKIIIKDENGNVIETTEDMFEMPYRDVTIEATFIKEEKNPETSDILINILTIAAIISCALLVSNQKKYKWIK